MPMIMEIKQTNAVQDVHVVARSSTIKAGINRDFFGSCADMQNVDFGPSGKVSKNQRIEDI